MMVLQNAKNLAISLVPQLTRVIGRWMGVVTDKKVASEPISASAVRRILVVELDDIGDTVMNVPFFRGLRSRFPDAHITGVVRPAAAELLQTCPYIDTLHVLGDVKTKAFRLPARYRYMLSFVREHLQDKNFDLAVLPRWEVDRYFAVCLAYLSGARWRLGYSEKVSLEKRIKNRGWDRLLTHTIHGGHGRHEVHRALGVIAFLGGDVRDDRLELWTTPEDEQFIEGLLRDAAVQPGEKLVAMMPGAALGRRQWPAERFVEVGRWLARRYGVRIVLLGGPADRTLGSYVKDRLGDVAIDTTGRVRLRQTVALLRRCELFIGNDTGPMHLAAAVGIPVVEISCHPQGGDPEHPNAPQRFGPLGVPRIILQPAQPRVPCTSGCTFDDPHCILEIEPTMVMTAAGKLLDRVPDPEPNR